MKTTARDLILNGSAMQRVRAITTCPLHSSPHATPELSDGENAKRLSRYFCCHNFLSHKQSAYNRCSVDRNRCCWLLFSWGICSMVYLVSTECLLAKRRKTHKSHVIVPSFHHIYCIYYTQNIIITVLYLYLSIIHPKPFLNSIQTSMRGSSHGS